jgi:arabinan endo-1,5-alpha-L-arabinosidase
MPELSKKIGKKFLLRYMVLLLLAGISEEGILALHNHYGAHDPTGIIKCEDTYWIFTTGHGPYAMYSKDLVKWTAGRTPLTPGTFPSWVTDYVPGFEGHFWAPECIYLNGLYHLYYSCSSWGSKQSAIGLLTTKSLNPESDDYFWQDQGVVVYSNASSEANCIDPSVFKDDSGKVWMSYGSYFGGIRVVELDSLTGKVSGSYHYPVASGGVEASYLFNGEDYYYLFINRGSCCQGVASTYHIQVGRSTSPTGPFLDKSGNNLNSGWGTTILSTSGSFIGPGHIGYYSENNTEFVTYHYYDGDDKGNPKLSIGTFKWSEDGWPVITNNWVEDGHYSILNENSQLAWDYSGAGADQDPVVQNTYTKAPSQKWTFEALGNGFYSIIPGGRDLVAGITPCTGSVGTKIALGSPESSPCQIWRVEKTNDLNLIFSSKYGNRVLEVPGSSTDAGTQLAINLHTGTKNQQWMLPDTFLSVSVRELETSVTRVRVYPNPVSGSIFYIEFNKENPVVECEIEILTSDGRRVFKERFLANRVITVENNLGAGVYFLRILENNNITCIPLINQRHY